MGKRSSNVLRNLTRIQNHVTSTVKKDVQQAVGDDLLERSQRQVPYDKGNLSRSGFSMAQGDKQIVGYDKPYATKLHYNPQFNFQNGRKGFYLVDPALELDVDKIAKDTTKKSLKRTYK